VTVRVEVATAGIDDALQGQSSDPFGTPVGLATGLRIPFFVANPARYLFLLCTRVVTKPTRLCGIRQLLTIGAQNTLNIGSDAGSIVQVIEFPVATPNFSFLDGNVSWHLVEEPNIWPVTSAVTAAGAPGLTDSTNFVQGNSDGPALLYQPGTVGWAEAAQPLYYFNAMNAYAPPPVWQEWEPIAGLGCFHDVRFPWLTAEAWRSLDTTINTKSARRISLYASVLQTAGGIPVSSASPPLVGFGPEQGFINAVGKLPTGGGGPTSVGPVVFYRVAGAMMFEDIDEKEAFDT
jgi:hypothetical protein